MALSWKRNKKNGTVTSNITASITLVAIVVVFAFVVVVVVIDDVAAIAVITAH